jgi:hypothetical protein
VLNNTSLLPIFRGSLLVPPSRSSSPIQQRTPVSVSLPVLSLLHMPFHFLCDLGLHSKGSVETSRSSTTRVDTQAEQSSWNVMALGDAREGKWRGNWRMEWVSSTFHTTSEHGVSNITSADAHTSAASSQLNWRPRRFKWTRPFRRKTKCGFCACAITFQTQSTASDSNPNNL